MNDLIPTASVEGKILYHGVDLYGPDVDSVEVRKRIGMVFQKLQPVPEVDLRQRRLRPAGPWLEEEPRRAGRARAAHAGSGTK